MYVRSMILLTTLAIAASAFAPAAATVSTGASDTGSDAPCWKAGTTVNIERCFVESGKRSDADLNRTYAQIMSVLNAGDRQRLQKAETSWITYRNAACDAEYRLWNGGTGGPPAKMACIDGETRRHLDYLRTTYRLRLQRLVK
jgi:uncharacterized protein YecT (DUF1311 family)